VNVNIKVKRLNENAVTPKYAHEFDSGFDLVAVEDTIIEPGETKIVPTGIAISLPPGYEAQIRPRSGITVKTKLRVQLGTIDQGYVGEIGVIVDNANTPLYEIEDYGNGPEIEVVYHNALKTIDKSGTVHEGSLLSEEGYPVGTYIIRKGNKIAQAVIAPVEQAHFVEVDELCETSRGSNGFGSSGVKSE
jgi:dUTP pyrophosphatase